MSATTQAGEDPFLVRIFGSGLARSCVVLVFILAFLVGAFAAGTGLHDPDTCWLLALGKIIYHSRALPSGDPWSFTFPASGKPFILYQWLTELIFYLLVHLGGLLLLVCAVGVVLTAAFIFFPLRLAVMANAPRTLSVIAVVIGTVAASSHFLARPEIFSYLMLSVWLSLLTMHRLHVLGVLGTVRGGIELGKRVQFITPLGIIAAIWCNLHTGFFAMFFTLAPYVVTVGLEALFKRRNAARSFTTCSLALLAVAGATLLNPWRIGLWQYIPHLFFSPINRFIDELRPLSLVELLNFFYAAFAVLALISLVSLLVAYFNWRKGGLLPQLYSPLLVIVLSALGISCRRLIPFASLGLVIECMLLWSMQDWTWEKRAVIRFAENRLRALDATRTIVWFISFALASLFGTYVIANRVVALQLPQSTQKAFSAPFDAISFLKRHTPPGRVFNHAQFGDVMIWYLAPVPPLFIDTRFDMYGDRICTDYLTIMNCSTGWQSLMKQYNIRWIFVPPNTAIAKQLQVAGWQVLFKDEAAVILQCR